MRNPYIFRLIYWVVLRITARMKRKLYSSRGPKVVKTSISLPDILLRFAEERCTEEGFNSVSAYFAHLIRLHRDRLEAIEKPSLNALNEDSSSKPARQLAEEEEKKLLDDQEGHA